jgi:hypothetical protein
MRLQEEANEEFRRRYPIIVLRPEGMAGAEEKKELGCCGYDELAHKPPTTSSINAAFLTNRMMSNWDPQAGLIKKIVPLQNL